MKTIIGIDGMMCSMCESHVNDAIRNNFTVKKVKSSRRKNQTTVISDEKLDVEKIKNVIESLGYKVIEIKEE